MQRIKWAAPQQVAKSSHQRFSGAEAAKNRKLHLAPDLGTVGRFLFAFSVTAFGVQQTLYGRFAGGLPLVSPWIGGGVPAADLIGVFLLIIGIGSMTKARADMAVTLLGM